MLQRFWDVQEQIYLSEEESRFYRVGPNGNVEKLVYIYPTEIDVNYYRETFCVKDACGDIIVICWEPCSDIEVEYGKKTDDGDYFVNDVIFHESRDEYLRIVKIDTLNDAYYEIPERDNEFGLICSSTHKVVGNAHYHNYATKK